MYKIIMLRFRIISALCYLPLSLNKQIHWRLSSGFFVNDATISNALERHLTSMLIMRISKNEQGVSEDERSEDDSNDLRVMR